jgi:hypothetical protein
MKREGPYSTDLSSIARLATLSLHVARPTLGALPLTRDGQKQLAGLLEPAISAHDYRITRDFLAAEVRLRDSSLLSDWSGTPAQLAWLMVHEELSNYFERYAIQRWEPEVLLLHHIPKTAGTSVYKFLEQSGYFVAFPQRSFQEMAKTYGLLGFSGQLAQYQSKNSQNRIYLGGHYNLPDKVDRLGIFGSCRGVILCRQPTDILGSAMRYIWTKAEGGDDEIAGRYDIGGLDGAELTAIRANAECGKSDNNRLSHLLMTIVESDAFRLDFDEVYVKYLYNGTVNTPNLLFRYLMGCGNLFPSLNARLDEQVALKALNVKGSLPRSNVSVLSHGILVQAFGGSDSFEALARARMRESIRIYEVLENLRSRFHPSTPPSPATPQNLG